jgi:hypothetical protein
MSLSPWQWLRRRVVFRFGKQGPIIARRLNRFASFLRRKRNKLWAFAEAFETKRRLRMLWLTGCDMVGVCETFNDPNG